MVCLMIFVMGLSALRADPDHGTLTRATTSTLDSQKRTNALILLCSRDMTALLARGGISINADSVR